MSLYAVSVDVVLSRRIFPPCRFMPNSAMCTRAYLCDYWMPVLGLDYSPTCSA